MKDLYKNLGVDEKATPDEIKFAYRRFAKKHHPDQGGHPNEFNRIAKAYAVLINPQKRKRYDETGETEQQTTPDQNLTMAVQRVAELVLGALKNCDFEHDDIIEICIDQLVRQETQFRDEIRKMEREKTVLEKYCKRFKFQKHKKQDFIKTIIENQIQETNRIIDLINQKNKIIQISRNILKDYGYDFERQESSYHFTFTPTHSRFDKYTTTGS